MPGTVFTSETDFVFGQTIVTIPTSTITFDINIAKAFPGILLTGSESNAVQAELIEVSGQYFMALNATWNDSTTLWNQTNPANPSFALALNPTPGGFDLYYQSAGAAPWNNAGWTKYTSLDVNGGVIVPPVPFTSAGQFGLEVEPTWNNGAAIFTALLVNALDSVSSVSSKLLDLQVNGVSKFSVPKSGIPQWGSNSAALPGYVTLGAGVILQWGNITLAGDGSGSAATVTFPLTFPNNCFIFLPGTAYEDSGAGGQLCEGTEVKGSRTTANTTMYAIGGTSANVTLDWIAIGN